MTFNTPFKLRSLRAAGLAGLACLLVPQVQAQMREGGYAYGGLSVGSSRGTFGNDVQAAASAGVGGSLTSFTRDDSATGVKVFGGWQFNRNLGLEAGYFDLGKMGYSASTLPAGTVDARYHVQGLNLDLVGTLPLSTNWSALARVGATAARTQARFTTTGAAVMGDSSQRKTDAKLGVGLQYALGSSLLMRAEVERYRVVDAMGSRVNVNFVSVGLVVPFGGPAPAPRAMAPAPYIAPVVAAPPPAPVIVVQAAPPPPPPVVVMQPAPPVPRRVSFSAESLFTFDRSAVSTEGMGQLDRFAKELDGTAFERVVVEGHTDRLGSTAYNQNLSQQRAEAVKSYLVTSGHVDPMKITASGKGEADPETKAADCVGTKATAKLIECLAPDRRVDVEVVGTR